MIAKWLPRLQASHYLLTTYKDRNKGSQGVEKLPYMCLSYIRKESISQNTSPSVS